MHNFHPILFKFCAYVNYILIHNMHRERKFPMTITNLAALFLELFEPPSYIGNNESGKDNDDSKHHRQIVNLERQLRNIRSMRSA